MEVLRNLFGTLTAGIIRLLVTVGILAAVYFFVIRPVLDTTEKIGHETNSNIQKSIQEANFGDVSKSIDDTNRRVQREVKRSLRQSQRHGAADKLIRCIQRAHQDVHKIQRCSERY
ncbi:MAG TPA: hypothetical protein VGW80_09255 [Solirubrobacterales bacterium]|jgi:F0F1-type ATP synthase membrane subunit b/b'|nr:hypothetical protein [Solirubrobacterales bacterium]